MALSPWQLCFHADLKCRVRTCNNRRIVGNTASSPYCRHHVCAVCLKVKVCPKRGHGEDKICHHHSRCKYIEAGRRCRGPRKGHNPSFPFCAEEHACASPECKEPRCPKKSSPYCAKHACSVKGCDQPRQSPGICCRRHTCHGRGCVNCINDPSSPSSPPPSGHDPPYYCHGHQVCQADRCEALVFHDTSHRAAKFCFQHYCAASAACESQRVEGDGARACPSHSCALYPTCVSPRADAVLSIFCESHECADAGCRKQTYDSGGAIFAATAATATTTSAAAAILAGKGKWCADHMCMAALLRRDDCGKRREGTVANPVYCADHAPCPLLGHQTLRCQQQFPHQHQHQHQHQHNRSSRCRCRCRCGARLRASATAMVVTGDGVAGGGGDGGGGGSGGGSGVCCEYHGAGGGDDDDDDDGDGDDDTITDHDHGDGCGGVTVDMGACGYCGGGCDSRKKR